MQREISYPKRHIVLFKVDDTYKKLMIKAFELSGEENLSAFIRKALWKEIQRVLKEKL